MRELVDAYALAVDRRDPEGVAFLFCEEGSLVTLFGPGSPESPLERRGRRAIISALTSGLAVYASTTHIVGSHSSSITGDTASGETRCLAHHVYERDGDTRLMVMAVNYEDQYLIEKGLWRFQERRLSVDWRYDIAIGGS